MKMLISRKNNTKGQAAIEYVMTYGWMLVAVSVIGGAAFQSLGFQCVPSVTGFEGEQVGIDDFATTNDEEIVFLIENDGRQDVDLQQARITGDLGAIWTSGGDSFIIEPGNESSIVTGQTGFQTAEQECSEFNVDIEYDTGPLEGVESSGRITAPIVGEGEVPDRPQDVELSATETQ